jgi:uncharacterized DUF497 family protein
MQFSWDKAKATTNKKKHKVSFEEAVTTFYDENALVIPDPDHSIVEERFIILGVSRELRLLLVSHCYRDKDEVVRIISARKAISTESEQYEEQL